MKILQSYIGWSRVKWMNRFWVETTMVVPNVIDLNDSVLYGLQIQMTRTDQARRCGKLTVRGSMPEVAAPPPSQPRTPSPHPHPPS